MRIAQQPAAHGLPDPVGAHQLERLDAYRMDVRLHAARENPVEPAPAPGRRSIATARARVAISVLTALRCSAGAERAAR